MMEMTLSPHRGRGANECGELVTVWSIDSMLDCDIRVHPHVKEVARGPAAF